jgi:hypothetical protein
MSLHYHKMTSQPVITFTSSEEEANTNFIVFALTRSNSNTWSVALEANMLTFHQWDWCGWEVVSLPMRLSGRFSTDTVKWSFLYRFGWVVVFLPMRLSGRFSTDTIEWSFLCRCVLSGRFSTDTVEWSLLYRNGYVVISLQMRLSGRISTDPIEKYPDRTIDHGQVIGTL